MAWGDKARRIELLNRQVADLSADKRWFADLAVERFIEKEAAERRADDAEGRLFEVRAELARQAALVERLTEALSWFVVVPDDVSTVETAGVVAPVDPATDPQCPACAEPRSQHDAWGCVLCTCTVSVVQINAAAVTP